MKLDLENKVLVKTESFKLFIMQGRGKENISIQKRISHHFSIYNTQILKLIAKGSYPNCQPLKISHSYN